MPLQVFQPILIESHCFMYIIDVDEREITLKKRLNFICKKYICIINDEKLIFFSNNKKKKNLCTCM